MESWYYIKEAYTSSGGDLVSYHMFCFLIVFFSPLENITSITYKVISMNLFVTFLNSTVLKLQI